MYQHWFPKLEYTKVQSRYRLNILMTTGCIVFKLLSGSWVVDGDKKYICKFPFLIAVVFVSFRTGPTMRMPHWAGSFFRGVYFFKKLARVEQVRHFACFAGQESDTMTRLTKCSVYTDWHDPYV